MKSPALAIAAFSIAACAFGNPYPDENAVPKDRPYTGQLSRSAKDLTLAEARGRGNDVVRFHINWEASTDTFALSSAVIEPSGTSALSSRSLREDSLGSYRASLIDSKSHMPLAFDSVGTGKEFRKLTRALTFRFPVPSRPFEFHLNAENPKTGVMEEVLVSQVDPKDLVAAATPGVNSKEVQIKLLKTASELPELLFNIYSDGYVKGSENEFWKSAQRVVDGLTKNSFPGVSRFTFQAVFYPSAKTLGSPKNLGSPVAERDSFLGLYYPYWDNFGRWTDVVYPTSEERFRARIGLIPYDYPLVLMESSGYWGIGNFNELTAIPSDHSAFTFLLLHELGHYFGLNEEYESGGRTELEFASQIVEPWSQNITFLKAGALKWASFLDALTPVPTSPSFWSSSSHSLGAYRGGYAQSPPLSHSHKPGFSCVMERSGSFCAVCKNAIETKVKFDLGE